MVIHPVNGQQSPPVHLLQSHLADRYLHRQRSQLTDLFYIQPVRQHVNSSQADSRHRNRLRDPVHLPLNPQPSLVSLQICLQPSLVSPQVDLQLSLQDSRQVNRQASRQISLHLGQFNQQGSQAHPQQLEERVRSIIMKEVLTPKSVPAECFVLYHIVTPFNYFFVFLLITSVMSNSIITLIFTIILF